MTDMKTDNLIRPLINITRDTLEEAVEILVRAFEDDPIVRYFLSGHERGYHESACKLFRYQCLMYIEMDLPVFGTIVDSRITGVACLSGPEKMERPDSLLEADREFETFMGPDSFGRIKQYMDLHKKHTPKEKHHYLGALGVHPDFQGQGLGRVLLDRVANVCDTHGGSKGIYLETAKPKNVEMYRHFGYNLLATEKLDGIVDKWYMFRPVEITIEGGKVDDPGRNPEGRQETKRRD